MVLNSRKEKVRASSTRMRNQDTPCGGGGGGGGTGGRTRTTTTTTARTKTASSSSIIKKITRKSRRKPGGRIRKPKYLSLRLQFSCDEKAQDQSSDTPAGGHPQLNLFPLHPENLVEDKDAHDENVACWFSAADGGATTLTGLLGAAATPSSSGEDSKNRSSTCTTTTNATLSPSSASLTYAYGGRQDSEEVALVRTAMRRNKEREPSEERWVRYSEVVERRDDQEVSSCSAAIAGADLGCWRNRGLSLKLNYQEILNAWSDKAPLYVHAAQDSPQTVPDIHDHDRFLPPQLSNGSSDGQGSCGGCVWRVPEMMMTKKTNEQGLASVRVKAEEQQEQVEVVGGKELKVGQREASVRRYKEKRQNRLFSKQIRYQVRKLNAEKRPRLKGRFVKRT
ncbi:uncharacterized protein LOC113751203 isoform X1 [Coffea eugenioides]|uniref:uncharacterized protein LOC113751203 isoform X1 n=1 Tax=Coffea eugenioides TaxID=49369 RepID=UPI000F60DAAC|nr:uncharacterized protein LOC113751203 isoform X1 [Coffea eugenioides]